VPLDGLDAADISVAVIKGQKLKDHNLIQAEPVLSELVEACRTVESAKRPSFDEIVIILNEVLARI
jgi:hypothetical protein